MAEPGDIATDEGLCGTAAVTLALEGLSALAARAAKIRHDEQHGTVASLTFLTQCRNRVNAPRRRPR